LRAGWRENPELHLDGAADDLFDDQSIRQGSWMMPDEAVRAI